MTLRTVGPLGEEPVLSREGPGPSSEPLMPEPRIRPELLSVPASLPTVGSYKLTASSGNFPIFSEIITYLHTYFDHFNGIWGGNQGKEMNFSPS